MRNYECTVFHFGLGNLFYWEKAQSGLGLFGWYGVNFIFWVCLDTSKRFAQLWFLCSFSL
ncbi:hypothetical protein K432DRAFT_78255 [Lepidopterella palustris CBS 459.81]|uniref:Uncharacterized protein n=1 Tax=Lepidopterella palustris CBS 459.81 TaxID=1314670 RepID=A0A8E2E804_9PEZI|nr:hypothetical protein K432DRAFT_78255 [Lepidopterella palustris CBS 459.81]